ncbi:MAG: type IV toxin-antitoxin system AbiEi family antitoxin domain-containing protein [Actinomycetota bacterium]|nr:type IV toxin-antitoxin system AbiEi family antitoxin domain-containing protein [Actinomycetota bacterium]
MRDIEIMRALKATGKDFFTLADLEKVTGLDRESLYVSLNRLQKRGTIERAMKGIYVVPGSGARLERIAGQLYFPCYLSFESVLSRFGVLNLVPYSLSFATTRKTKTLAILGRQVDYRQVKEELYFGFDTDDGYYIAKPEKALLDLIYLATLGKASLPTEELDLAALSLLTLRDFTEKFPPMVEKRLDGML